MRTDLANADTVVFKGGLLCAVPDWSEDTVRLDRPLPPVPPIARRPAVRVQAPAGRRVAILRAVPTARARAIGYGAAIAFAGVFGALWADDVTHAYARLVLSMAAAR